MVGIMVVVVTSTTPSRSSNSQQINRYATLSSQQKVQTVESQFAFDVELCLPRTRLTDLRLPIEYPRLPVRQDAATARGRVTTSNDERQVTNWSRQTKKHQASAP